MMHSLVETAIKRSRTTLSLLFLIIVVGTISRLTIPIEADPNIAIPIVAVTVYHEGISPEDAERLLVKPMEVELRSTDGLKRLDSSGNEGAGVLILEFEAGFDVDAALADIRASVDRAKAELPDTAEEPVVTEFSTADFPSVVVALSAEGIPERKLYRLARDLKNELETLSMVQEVQVSGDREELLEAVIDISLLDSYSISQEQLANAVLQNNRLIPAGSLDTGQGRFSIKVPGLIETPQDLMSLPIKNDGNKVVTIADVASVKRTFKDANSYSRVNGKPAVALNVIKRVDANLIDTVKVVREKVAELRKDYPPAVVVSFPSDASPFAQQQVTELEGNILTAMALVMTIVVAALGLRSGILVGLAVPVSFLFALIILRNIGFSFNFMVMFGMLLGLGMLIDGAIVVTEYADRMMADGHSPGKAYILAANRMFWPVIASTATTLAAFLPLMFWPGVSGEFMRYMPITVFAVLLGSLLYALVFGPVLGSIFGKPGAVSEEERKNLQVLENGDPRTLNGVTGWYARLLDKATKHPITITFSAFFFLFLLFRIYGAVGEGLIFFTDMQPQSANVHVHARGNLSPKENYQLVLEAEAIVSANPNVENIYTRTAGGGGGPSIYGPGAAPDRVGSISFEIVGQERRDVSARKVLDQVRQATQHMSGIEISVEQREQGPDRGKELQLEITGYDLDELNQVTAVIRKKMNSIAGLIDLEDSRSLPGIQWELKVDRAQASLFGANVTTVGTTVQLVTNGLKVGEYRPDDATDSVDIRIRFPEQQRFVNQLDSLRVTTPQGLVPISSFVQRTAHPKTDKIQRLNGKRVMFVKANTVDTLLPSDVVKELEVWLKTQNLPKEIQVHFGGSAEQQAEAGLFLASAAGLALFMMGLLLVTQFNSFYQTVLILSSVVMSTAGVLIGLLVNDQAFSVILTGVGIVALAGIVVNNNIVLIDTYNYLKSKNPRAELAELVVRTGAQRLRPVFLTTFTTIFGLLPLACHLSIDFISRDIVYGGQMTAFWVRLANAIVWGLSFATVLTLIVTPAMLMLPQALKTELTKLQLALAPLPPVKAMVHEFARIKALLPHNFK